jgi:hypothetical protein
MAAATSPIRKIPVSAWIIAALAITLLAAGMFYLNRPAKTVADAGEAPAEAKAYLPNLQLSDVTMQATANFMQQQVVEVQGKIANRGPRKLAVVEVYCLFYGADGKEVHRERLPIVRALEPGETRGFRLPFDSLPDAWNQAMPRLAIAKIAFTS